MKVTKEQAALIFDRVSAVRERLDRADLALSTMVQSFVDAELDDLIDAYSELTDHIDKAYTLADVLIDDAEKILDKN